MMDLLYYWWAIGFASCLAAGSYLNREGMSIKDFLMVTAGSVLFGLLGPVLTYFIVKWFWEAWRDSLPIDDQGRRDYPWRKD